MDSSKIIGISATVIALASLVLSVQQGRATRHHDRLMVRPCLVFSYDYVHGDPEYGLLLSNKGIGPAFVQELRIFVDGKRVEADEEWGWKHAKSALGISGLPWIHYSSLPVISAGEAMPLIAIKKEHQNRMRESRLSDAIKRLRIEVAYESGYEERFTESSSEWKGKCSSEGAR